MEKTIYELDDSGNRIVVKVENGNWFRVKSYSIEMQGHYHAKYNAISALRIDMKPEDDFNNPELKLARINFIESPEKQKRTHLRNGILDIYLDTKVMQGTIHMLESNRPLSVAYWNDGNDNLVGFLSYD